MHDPTNGIIFIQSYTVFLSIKLIFCVLIIMTNLIMTLFINIIDETPVSLIHNHSTKYINCVFDDISSDKIISFYYFRNYQMLLLGVLFF